MCDWKGVSPMKYVTKSKVDFNLNYNSYQRKFHELAIFINLWLQFLFIFIEMKIGTHKNDEMMFHLFLSLQQEKVKTKPSRKP